MCIIPELVLGILILVFGVGCTATTAAGGMYREGACDSGTGIWTGILAIVSASFGVAAMRRLRNKCLLVAFFILCILAAVATGILFLVSAVHSVGGINRLRWRSYIRPMAIVTLVQNVLLTLIGLAYAICCTISASLLCYSWGCTKCCTEANGYHNPNTEANVVYMPNTGITQQFGGNQQYILVPMSSTTATMGSQSGALILQPRELQPLNPAGQAMEDPAVHQPQNA